MTINDEREKAAEKQYINQVEKPFKIRARRDKMLAIWVATLLGRDIERCLEEIIEVDFSRGEEGIFQKLERDIGILGLSDTHNLIREKMHKCLADAVREVEGSVAQ
ncbi:ATPase inhibitor subunit zeta [Agrobacterium salinitolerans]|nr:ATPase inhibitor subunit zeta [Agrobacterium salinitolerans]